MFGALVCKLLLIVMLSMAHLSWTMDIEFQAGATHDDWNDSRPPSRSTTPGTPREWVLASVLKDANSIYSVAFNSQGKLASGGKGLNGEQEGEKDNSLCLWDSHVATCVRSLPGHTKQVYTVAFGSHDSDELLASGSADATIRLWDLRDHSTIDVLHGHEAAVKSVSFSPEGLFLASASRDTTVRLWDLRTRKILQVLAACKGGVYQVIFNKSGATITSGGYGEKIRIWKLVDEVSYHELWCTTSYVASLAFISSDQLVSGNGDGKVRLCSASGEEMSTLFDATWCVPSLIAGPGGTIIFGSYDKKIRWFDICKRRMKQMLSGHESVVLSVATAPHDQLMASGSYDKTIRLWRLGKKQG